MFGRVRASSCPAESLERPPSKIFKDDSLSIYEATLMKLKLGSQRNPNLCSDNEVMDMEPMSVEFECASSAATSSSHQGQAVTTSSSDCNSVGSVMQPRNKEVSVLYLFSKFKKTSEEKMTVDSVGVSLSSSGSGSINNTQQQSEHECISSLPASRIRML